MTSEVEIRVYNAEFEPQGFIGNPHVLVATPRHNQQPTASIAMLGNDRKVSTLAVPGTRVVIRYRGEHMISGPCRLRHGAGLTSNRVVTFEVEDDWRILANLLLWQVPGSAITAQSGSEYHILTGPAETVVKTFMAAAAARTSRPVTIAPDLGRGATITVQARMDKGIDVFYPLVDQAGIGVTVRQVGAGLVLDCYEPADAPINLSEAGGTLTELGWSQRLPTITRAVLGADGDGTARVFREYIDTALESDLNDVMETFVDGRDLKHTDPGFEAAALARMQAAVAAGGIRSGISVTLAETDTLRYGGPNGRHVGDRVVATVAEGLTVTDVLRSATLTWSKGGEAVTPVVGGRDDDPDTTFADSIAALARAQRTSTTRS